MSAMKPWENPRLVSLGYELAKQPDVEFCWMRGGHGPEGATEQPWVMPIYGQSAELELMDLLYCMVRYLRPKVVVELGCHLGLGTYALGRGVQDAGGGVVYTCDNNNEYVRTTISRCLGLPVQVFELDSQDSAMVHIMHEADLLWLDCDYEGRVQALDEMKVGAVAVIHDTQQEPDLRKAVDANMNAGFQYVHFGQTHRGMSIVQRVK